MKVLVTGGAGFIGSHTVDLLLEKGYEVRILDSLQPRVHPRGKPDYVPAEAEFIKGDVANRADLAPVPGGYRFCLPSGGLPGLSARFQPVYSYQHRIHRPDV